jgi:hypothetical protein
MVLRPNQGHNVATHDCSRQGVYMPHRSFAKSMLRRFAGAIVVGLFAVGWAAPAAAYRPFDGTDAAVADVGEVEIEFQPTGAWRVEQRNSLSGPNGVLNYGFAERWEFILQGENPAPEGAGPTSVPNGAFLKYVIQPGVLQDKPGPSIATEFGLLLPPFGGTGTGLGWNGIVSQRWDWGTAHFNVETNLTPDQHGQLLLDVILEGPHKWTVRPVFEVYSDSVFGLEQTYSVLVGAIWQVSDKLSFDVGLRHAWVDRQPVNELRAGVTFGFPLKLGRPTSEPTSAMQLGRR